jgi:hypothetical protein
MFSLNFIVKLTILIGGIWRLIKHFSKNCCSEEYYCQKKIIFKNVISENYSENASDMFHSQ